MQYILNKKERQQAFFQYLAFFLLAVGLIIVAIFFNYQIPGKVNSLLRDELATHRSIDIQQEKFIKRMNEAKLLLDSLKYGSGNQDLLNMQLTEKIMDLHNLQPGDSTAQGQVNKIVFELFMLAQQGEKNRLSAERNEREKIEFESKFNNCQRDLTTIQGQLDNLRNQTGF
jgi:hypothetical protein